MKRTFLQPLADLEGVETAREADAAQQPHQEDRLGIALPEPIAKDAGGRDLLFTIVPELDFVLDEVVDSAKAPSRFEVEPTSFADERLNCRCVEVEQRRLEQIPIKVQDIHR